MPPVPGKAVRRRWGGWGFPRRDEVGAACPPTRPGSSPPAAERLAPKWGIHPVRRPRMRRQGGYSPRPASEDEVTEGYSARPAFEDEARRAEKGERGEAPCREEAAQGAPARKKCGAPRATLGR
ncbi:hypothetical protein GCM10010252_51090 [Streptomyces aureoverticillatus]|nr:hypothetical protein GCM10010252_51090 [Streptomyces aureoverticillatus]